MKEEWDFPECYVVKAVWRGTSLLLRVGGNDWEHALKRAETKVMRMEGGCMCMGVHFVRQVK